LEQPETLSGSLISSIVALLVSGKNQPFDYHERSSMALDFAEAEGINLRPRNNEIVQCCPKIMVGPPRIGAATKLEDSPVIEDVLAVRTNFQGTDVDSGGIEDSRQLRSVVALDGAVDWKGPVVRVTKTPPGATAGSTKIWMTIWVNTSAVSPGDNPTITEDVVISVKGGSRGLNSVNFLKLRGAIYGRETGDKGIEFRSLYHDSCIAGAGMPPGRVNRRRLE
jgi:hypothetical protein